jgi:DNA-binding IclR family transcriptional regulator
VDKQLKTAPSYRIASVDNALRIAAMLQMEGALTVKEVASRIGVAGSTAHRLLQMLVYRDFAVQDHDRTYRVGPILELGSESRSDTSRLRTVGLPHLRHLVDELGESANLAVRVGDTVRFIASVESDQLLRVTSREGMVFPIDRTTAGLLMLAELSREEVDALYGHGHGHGPEHEYAYEHDVDERHEQHRPNMAELHQELDLVRRRKGFAVAIDRAERGVVAIGVPVRGPGGELVAGLAVAMPSIRYDKERLPHMVNMLRRVASKLEVDLQ